MMDEGDTWTEEGDTRMDKLGRYIHRWRREIWMDELGRYIHRWMREIHVRNYTEYLMKGRAKRSIVFTQNEGCTM